MQRLSDELPIRIWEEISTFVNTLHFESASKREFSNNLTVLRNLLSASNICLDFGEINPQSSKEVGLATLLYHIYHIEQEKKEDTFSSILLPNILFAKQIMSLKNIGVQYIRFGYMEPTIMEDMRVTDMRSIYSKRDVEVVKYYTDGVFRVEKGKSYSSYHMENLQDQNYYLEEFLYLAQWKLYIGSLCAYLNNFNGVYPDISEIMSLSLPMLQDDNNEIIDFQETKKNVKEYFKAY